MIVSVDRIKEFVTFPETWTDERIKLKLDAIEQTIRAYTNNNFQNRAYQREADIVGGVFYVESLAPFDIDDTVQISYGINAGLYTVSAVSDDSFMVNEAIKDDTGVTVTKIEYPADVLACCVNLMEWEVQNRGKVGIKSETLSRHSVTYFDIDSGNQVMGYPASLLGCLKSYRKVVC